MEKSIGLKKKYEDEDEDEDEEQLFQLIKQAGKDARIRKHEALKQHFNKLQTVIAEAFTRKNNSVSR